jgi:transcription factor WhiB
MLTRDSAVAAIRTPEEGYAALAAALWGDFSAPAWHNEAACSEIGPELFCDDNMTAEDARQLREICMSCPVRAQCAADAEAWETSSPFAMSSHRSTFVAAQRRGQRQPRRRRPAAESTPPSTEQTA